MDRAENERRYKEYVRSRGTEADKRVDQEMREKKTRPRHEVLDPRLEIDRMVERDREQQDWENFWGTVIGVGWIPVLIVLSLLWWGW